MSQPELIVLAVALAIVIPLTVVIMTVNRYARLRNLIRESWSNVDVQLKRRYDLIPALVETVRGYAAHEQETFARVVDARNRAMASVGSVSEHAAGEGELVRSVNALLARIEDYPELKASEHFLELQEELAKTEDRIAAARRFYNANVREYNTMLETFPSSMFASDRTPETYFEVDTLAVREPASLANKV
jgi:LemA protein